ncbi:MAG: hypothetical protein KTR31_19840 [Myxococcales bacterium]|nr:hypothetical protein [Myxococcales bacterium]
MPGDALLGDIEGVWHQQLVVIEHRDGFEPLPCVRIQDDLEFRSDGTYSRVRESALVTECGGRTPVAEVVSVEGTYVSYFIDDDGARYVSLTQTTLQQTDRAGEFVDLSIDPDTATASQAWTAGEGAHGPFLVLFVDGVFFGEPRTTPDTRSVEL